MGTKTVAFDIDKFLAGNLTVTKGPTPGAFNGIIGNNYTNSYKITKTLTLKDNDGTTLNVESQISPRSSGPDGGCYATITFFRIKSDEYGECVYEKIQPPITRDVLFIPSTQYGRQGSISNRRPQ